MKAFLALTALLLTSLQVFALPAQVVIIRHGEKPDTGNQVNQQGCERAFMLPGFFASNKTVNAFGKPVAIFAMQPDPNDGSVRPVQTIAPTAATLGLEISDKFARLDYSAIVDAIDKDKKHDGNTVIISWEHMAIPGLAQAFGVVLTSDTQAWPDTVFDEAWILTFDKSGKNPTLNIIPEYVLPGDNPQGGSQWGAGNPNDNGPATPKAVIDECVNNDALNKITEPIVKPKLSPKDF